MATQFVQLNHGWNAHPNGPDQQAHVQGDAVTLEFYANHFQFPRFAQDQRVRLVFSRVWRYGFSSLNDEGWYRGQCRYSGIAPDWGEFYEVSGDLKLDRCKVDWQYISESPAAPTRHFLFYLRDNTFECDAASWAFSDQ